MWPQGFSGALDWISALITLIAATALFRFKRNVIEVITVCAIIGLILKNLI
jgi:chromate transporter